jgi:DNA-binding CsgD family transcriptional regulator/Tfp pilus assembly protein PilF
MLVGRDAEMRVLDRMVGGARISRSGALVLVGDAGIGKTALLDRLAGTVEGVRVLRAAGSEFERDLAFAGLHQLLHPLLGLLETIPAPQAEALAVALALRHGETADRFAVGTATLSLISRAAEEVPLLLMVDDAHDLDHASAEALAFAARRIVVDPVAVLAASRPVPGTLADSGLPRLNLTGLSEQAVVELLRTHAAGPVTAEVAARLHEATSGNPLAVVELSGSIVEIERLAPPVPLPMPDRMLDEYVRRTRALPARVRTALLVASIAEGDLALVERATRDLGADLEGLHQAEDVGLIGLAGGAVEFRHPLARAGAYGAAGPDERRRAHAAVADTLTPGDADRRAWHLSESVTGADDAVATTVAEMAHRYAERGAHAVAARAFERAARLTTDPTSRAERLTVAGESASLAGQPGRALELLDRAAAIIAASTPQQARIDGLRGVIEMRTGSLERARDLLDRALRRLERADDPEKALTVAYDLVTTCFYLGDTAGCVATADRIEPLLDRVRTASARVRAELAIGIARVLGGGSGIELVRRAVHALQADPPRAEDDPWPAWTLVGPLFLREAATGRELVERAERDLRARCSIGALPGLLLYVSLDASTSDRWDSARSGYEEGVGLARETGQTTELTLLLARLGWLQARRGDEEACQRHVAEASRLADRHHIHLAQAWSTFALGDLELGLGRPETALDNYGRLDAFLARIGLADVDVAPGPEQVECLLRLGRAEEAAGIARGYRARAEAKGQPWACARAERALAMVGTDTEPIAHFDTALEHHRSSPDAFEEARTRLAYGMALRKLRRRTDARPQLRDALATFESLGATPWANRAAAELAATGEHPQRRGESDLDRLTPQELQIARLLGTGSTTKQAAASLFLSPKTVEYHLRHVYTKLGINSRAQLAEALEQRARSGV